MTWSSIFPCWKLPFRVVSGTFLCWSWDVKHHTPQHLSNDSKKHVFQTILHTKLLKKQLRFSQLKSSNSYQIGMLRCASLPVTCSLLIARDLEANDLSKPAPVTGEEIYRNPGVKKKQPDWISTEPVLVSIHPKSNGTILSVGPIGDFLDSILFFTTSW